MNKFIEELTKVKSEDATWLIYNLNKLDNKFTLIEFGYEYQDFCEYDGNPQTDTSSAIFGAYCVYKKNRTILREEARYLNNRSGVLGTYYSEDGCNSTSMTVKQLIEIYEENTHFHEWLVDLAK